MSRAFSMDCVMIEEEKRATAGLVGVVVVVGAQTWLAA
jgi:hypothetical protein